MWIKAKSKLLHLNNITKINIPIWIYYQVLILNMMVTGLQNKCKGYFIFYKYYTNTSHIQNCIVTKYSHNRTSGFTDKPLYDNCAACHCKPYSISY